MKLIASDNNAGLNAEQLTNKDLAMSNESTPHCATLDSKIDIMTTDVTEMKRDIKSINAALNKMAVVEERIAALLKMSEQNGKSIDELWSRIDTLREENVDLRERVLVADGNAGFNSRALDRIIHVTLAIGIGVVIFLLTENGQ